MPGYFNGTIAAQLAGNSVKVALLVEMRFLSRPMYLWNGNGDLDAGGHIWKGLRGLGQVDGLEQAINGAAPQAVFTLTGVDIAVQAEEQGAPSDYVNKPIVVYMQFFNQDWSLLDAPYAIWSGTMQTVQESYGYDESKKAWVSSVGITAESWFVGRGRPPASFYSDRDQQLRAPGDKGLQYMPQMQNYTIRWPDL